MFELLRSFISLEIRVVVTIATKADIVGRSADNYWGNTAESDDSAMVSAIADIRVYSKLLRPRQNG